MKNIIAFMLLLTLRYVDMHNVGPIYKNNNFLFS